MNCVLYARVSTDKQAEKDLSIPAQLRIMREYAARQGWTILEEFVEAGATATTISERPVLRELLDRVRTRVLRCDAVIAHKFNRMARNIEDYVPLRAALKKQGIRIVSVAENVDESASGQLVENIMASIAQFESANLSDETKKGMRQKVVQGGWPHKPPRGYFVACEPDSGLTSIRIHPRLGPLVRRMFELYATGLYAIVPLAERLAGDGLVSRSGGPIPKSQVHRMLTNPFYAGRVRWKDLDVPGTHPQLVAPELFSRVQEVIASRFRETARRRGTPDLPLRGIATCASCRGRMTGEWHDRWGYYRCGRQSYRRQLCQSRMCSQRRAHADLERILKTTQMSLVTAQAIQRQADALLSNRVKDRAWRAKQAVDEYRVLADAESRLTDAFIGGKIEPARYAEEARMMRERRTELDARGGPSSKDAEVISARVRNTLALATSLWDVYENLDGRSRAALLGAVFAGIVMSHAGIVSHSLKPPFGALAAPGRAAKSAEELIDNLAGSQTRRGIRDR